MTAVHETEFTLQGGDHPLILVPARMQERGPFPFVVDTGASVCVAGEPLAAELALPDAGERGGHSASGAIRARRSHADSVEVGGARVEDLMVAITDLSGLGRVIGREPAGILGYNFMRGFRVSIDYRSLRLRLEPGDLAPVEDGPAAATLPFRLAAPAKPLVLIEAGADGRDGLTFAVDTGASTTVLAPSTAAALGLQVEAGEPLTGAGGAIVSSVARLGELRLAGARCAGVEVAVSDFLGPLGEVVGARLDGILGFNVLRRFRVTIDYPGSQLVLREAV